MKVVNGYEIKSFSHLESANLERANLVGANLERASLESANLESANLKRANLESANLERANLKRANLERTNLESANLERANLVGANLERASLERANLERANLERANLERANLERANLESTNLVGAYLPSPAAVLLANWGELSDETTLQLMRLDCSCLPDGEKLFDLWTLNNWCPFADARVKRIANFVEKRHLWSYGPPPTLWDAMTMVLDEKCPGWRD